MIFCKTSFVSLSSFTIGFLHCSGIFMLSNFRLYMDRKEMKGIVYHESHTEKEKVCEEIKRCRILK